MNLFNKAIQTVHQNLFNKNKKERKKEVMQHVHLPYL